jgi:hypothetical protein
MQIYQTYRNADETEGRGPVVPDLAFLHKEHAERYIDEQPGIRGRRGKWSLNQYGDWYIIPVNVIDYDTVELECNKEKIRQGALKKLSKEEKEALGLTGP